MSSETKASPLDGTDIAIRVRNVTKRYLLFARPVDRLKQMIWRKRRFYQEITVLQDVSFEVSEGETVGIIGRNGAGKSTLLQILAGTLSPSEGSVQVKGRVAPLIELGAGFNPEFSGHDNIMVYGQLLGMSHAEIERKYDEIVSFADIGAYIERPVKTYSSGMYARLAFAVAIHVDPKILIVDEILAVGDAPFQQKCLNRFYEIKEGGCTILVVAHDQYLVRSMCDKAAYLKNGQLVTYGTASEVTGLYLEDIQPPAEQISHVSPEPPSQPSAAPSTTSDPEDPAGGAAADPPSTEFAAPVEHPPGKLFEITEVAFLAEDGTPIETMRSHDSVKLRMRFRALTDTHVDGISFVFNLYKHDGLYVCGATTLMEGIAPHRSGRQGEVTVTFPNLPLLAGKYMWRVAVNDHGGVLVHADAKGVCPFRVVDTFRSVGLVDLDRIWNVTIDGEPGQEIVRVRHETGRENAGR
ncbi:ABC transporter ATP-binding protein [Bradyrhizobium sp. AUGA SZCCT0283]|uniref:ABC transporter ATP-binding protein n=1 Tax=Bradyrhizobium sp. AUGA SZCCT0283 TaxID=2807671 RepID=UPI001BA513E5|nr:ABC transporter ATP-binding protein [Bradyrhizobium sp. AUGA SZCCT0283]MBR1277481.1 ATP-binding cassette domain-containing protein [Bradyrhizobium sp. AUGA SZCCT0283]